MRVALKRMKLWARILIALGLINGALQMGLPLLEPEGTTWAVHLWMALRGVIEIGFCVLVILGHRKALGFGFLSLGLFLLDPWVAHFLFLEAARNATLVDTV